MPYTNEDFRSLLRGLIKYGDEDMDQWAAWRLPSAYGDVYVNIRRSPQPGATEAAYDHVWPDMPLGEDR